MQSLEQNTNLNEMKMKDITEQRDEVAKRLEVSHEMTESLQSQLSTLTSELKSTSDKNNNVSSSNFNLTKKVKQMNETIEDQSVKLVKSR